MTAPRSAPLTLAQERLWFLQQLHPVDASFNVYLASRLRGPLDQAVLEQALLSVVERHEVLRTVFPQIDGQPVAQVLAGHPIDIAVLDIDAVRVGGLVAELVNRPFDLTSAPPVRLSLLRIGPDDHVLSVVLHHIVADGWSCAVFYADLIAFYNAGLAGRPCSLAPLALQYSDVARQRRATGVPAEALGYWRSVVEGAPPLELPTDRQRRPGSPNSSGAFVNRILPAELVYDLERVARAHRCTVFLALLAAYRLFLAQHSGQSDFCIAVPVAGRDEVEWEPLVGYFTNTVLVRVDVAQAGSYAGLLRATRAAFLGAMQHQEAPFEELLTELGADRDPQRSTFFQTMFAFQSKGTIAGTDATFDGLEAEPFDSGFAQAKFDLFLDMWPGSDGAQVSSFCYHTEVFDAGTVESMATRWVELLRALVASPQAPLDLIPAMSAAEQRQLLTIGAGPAGDGPQAAELQASQSVPALIDSALAYRADAIAVVCGQESMSGFALDAAANRWRAVLQDAGVGVGDVVGVLLPRSTGSIAALLGIWRSGAAYLPLGEDLPVGRLSVMIAACAIRVVVTSPPFADRLPSGVTAITNPGPDVTTVLKPVTPQLDDAAYILFTSGSTGAPKGVVVSHRNVAARVAWMRKAYALTANDQVVQFAALSFDTHVEEIYPALVSGAVLALLPEGALSLPEFLATATGGRTTVLDLPTPYWHQLVDDLDNVAWPQRLRLVILGGDRVHAAPVARWQARFGAGVRLVNTYGPTEATVIASATDLDRTDLGSTDLGSTDLGSTESISTESISTESISTESISTESVGTDGAEAVSREDPPIGRPISDTRLYILDATGALTPPGTPGELYIAGAGVARGYWGQPALTAERFVPDPFGPAGTRMYRTGDRARWLQDGRLGFLGRVDRQIKLRGVRVEPAEIETALVACPGVAEAVVVVQDDALVAYVVGGPDHDRLSRELELVLPPPLVPSIWVSLERLPLTVNGKVDVARLPAPATRPAGDDRHVAPRTDAERLVAEVWSEVLGVPQVGAADDFFRLGGHSLLAIRTLARVSAVAGVAIPITTLFTERTVERFAVALENLVIDDLSMLSEEEAAALLVDDAR